MRCWRACLDDLSARVGDHASHLHGVPARPPPHDVAVEAVQDALVRQLQAVVHHAHVGRLCCLQRVARSLPPHLIFWGTL